MNERQIFDEALAIDNPDDRRAFLVKACGDNTELRQHIENLLSAQQKLGSFLESPPSEMGAGPTRDEPVRQRPGSRIGPYKLLQKIGEGGFGVVYMAEQAVPVRRKVALKIIKPGMDSKDIIARFEAERQALALMDHPNIAKVLDAGATEGGRPYFVMELVKGVPITEYCDKNHLPTRERLGLFTQVCNAIQHAHQKGVIHRDLKPTNIMVTLHDGKPVPKVIDFGVAKALSQQLTEKTLFTQYGAIIGTPVYMSPEQAEMSGLDIDTRSDVYSLGVLLYELLTGSTPFDAKRLRSAGYAEMQRIIREEEPPKPSTRVTSMGQEATVVSSNRSTDPKKLGQVLRGELDWIVLKALDKDRSRRYESASAFAADIERYLSDVPVFACPPSTAYRLRKYARRHKIAFATVSLVVVALVVGLIGTAWQAIRATHAEQLAQRRYEDERNARHEADQARKKEAEQRQIADRQRESAELAKEEAEQARDEAKTESERSKTVVNILMELLGSSHLPDEVSKPSDYTVAQMVWDFSKRIPPQLESQPAIEADVRSIIGRALAFYENHAEAIGQLERAQTIRRDLYGENHPEYAKSLLDFCEFYAKAFMPKKAEEFARTAMAISRQLPEEIELRLRCTDALAKYEPLLEKTKLVEDGLAYARQHGEESNPLAVNLLLHHARVLFQKSNQSAEEQRDLKNVAAAAHQALEAHKRVYGEMHPLTGDCHQLAGEIAESQGELPQAEEHYIAVLDSLVAHLMYRYGARGLVMQRLETIYKARNDDSGFEALLQRYQNAGTPRYFFWQAIQSLESGDFAEYREVCRRMAEMYDGNENDIPRDYLLWTVFPRQDAVDDWQPVLTLAAKYSAKFPDSTYGKALYGMILYRAGRYSEALDALKMFTDSIPENATPEFFDINRYFSTYPVLFRAMAHHQLGDRDSSLRWFAKGSHWFHWNLHTDQWTYPMRQRVITQVIHEEARRLIDPDPDVLTVDGINGFWYLAQSQLHKSQGDFAAMRLSQEKAIELEPENGRMRRMLADVLRETGRHSEAIGEYSSAIELAPDQHALYIHRGYCRRALGQFEKALADMNRGLELDSGPWPWLARGDVYVNMGELELAVQDFTRGLANETHNRPHWLWNRGECYRRLQRYNDAIADYRAALDAGHTDKARLLQNIADCYRLLRQTDEAILASTRAADRQPDAVWALAERAALYSSAGDAHKSIADYQLALEKDPENLVLLKAYAQQLIRTGDNQAAKSALDKAIELSPDDFDLQRDRGDCLTNLRQYEAALEDFDRAIELASAASQISQAHQHRSRALFQMGRYDEALGDCHRAIETNHENAWASWHIGVGEVARCDDADFKQAFLKLADKVIESCQENKTYAYVHRGVLYREWGYYEEALADFNAAVKVEPNFSSGYANLAETYRRQQDYARAIELADKAIELDAENSSHWHTRGDIYNLWGKYEQAIDDYTKAIELDANHFWAHNNRGDCLLALGQHERAITDYVRAMELEPANAMFISKLADTYTALAERENSPEKLTEAIELHPENAELLVARGNVYRKLSEKEKALADFDRAIELAPQNAHYFHQRSQLFVHDFKDYDRAIADATRAADLEPENRHHWNHRGNIHKIWEHYELAIADYERGFELDTSDHNNRFKSLVDCYTALGKREQATTQLNHMIEDDPENTDLLHKRGDLHGMLGMHREAIDDYSKAIEQGSKAPWTWLNRGHSYAALGQNDKALADYRATLQLETADAHFLFVRGERLMGLKAYGHASEDFERAIKLAPDQTHYRKRAALAHFHLGQFEQAIVDLQVRIEADPKDTSSITWIDPELVALCPDESFKQGMLDLAELLIELSSDQSSGLVARAKLLFALEKNEAAEADLARALEMDADNAPLWNEVGLLYGTRGVEAKAYEHYSRAIDLDPQLWYAWFNRGLACNKLGRADEAITDFTKATELDPDNARSWNQRGITFSSLGRHAEAQADYSKFIELAPDNAVAWSNRAHAHNNLGHYEQAIADATRSLELDAKNTNALNWRILACQALARWNQAADDYTRLLEIEPNQADHLLGRGMAYQRAGQQAEADADFERYLKPFDEAVDGHPDDWQAVNRRGVARTKLERWEAAITDFAQALELAPNESLLYQNRAHCRRELQQWSAAAEDLAKVIELGDSDWQPYYHLALCRLAEGDTGGYQRACQLMVAAHAETDNPLEANFAAWTCCLAPAALDDWDGAIRLARFANQLQGASLQNANTLGTLLMRAGQTDEAIKFLTAVAAQLDNPSSTANTSPAYTWYGLALAYQQAGQAEQAKQWRDKADAWTVEQLGGSTAGDNPNTVAWNRRLTLELFRDEIGRALATSPANDTDQQTASDKATAKHGGDR